MIYQKEKKTGYFFTFRQFALADLELWLYIQNIDIPNINNFQDAYNYDKQLSKKERHILSLCDAMETLHDFTIMEQDLRSGVTGFKDFQMHS